MRILSAAVVVFLVAGSAHGQQKMDLDDITIKGELHNDDRLRMLAREKNKIKNYVKFRTSYRAEMVQGLMKPEPVVRYDNFKTQE